MQSPPGAAGAASGQPPPAGSAAAAELSEPSTAPSDERRDSLSVAERLSGDLHPVAEGDEEEDDAGDCSDGAVAADAAEADAPEASATAQAAADPPAAAAAKPASVKNTCRVEGCTRSLLKEKNYFRRYRCCKEHSRSPMVVIDGEQKRFCQQCCSFHPLEAFDGDRRNCRERLAMHNDRRRKRSQSNTATQTAASSRPVRVNAGTAPGSVRTSPAAATSGTSAAAAAAATPDDPPLPSIRTASGFGLSRPPTGLSGYITGGGGGYGGAQPGLGGGHLPGAGGGSGGLSAAELETARRASEPPANFHRAAASFLSEAGAILGRPSSRAAAMYGSAYGARLTGSTFSSPLAPGGMYPGGGGGGHNAQAGGFSSGFGGGFGSGFGSGSSLASPSYGGMQGTGPIGNAPSPVELSRAANSLGGGSGGGGYNDAGDSPGLQSVRTVSGRGLQLKRRGSASNEMRNLNIHVNAIDLDDRPDSIKRASFGLDGTAAGGVHRASFGAAGSLGDVHRASFGTDSGPASVYRASWGMDGSLGGVRRPSFGADGGSGFSGGLSSVQRPSFGQADNGFGGMQRPSFGADPGVQRPSFGADPGVQRPSFGGSAFGGDAGAVHRPSFEAQNVRRSSFGPEVMVRHPSGGSSHTGSGYGTFADLSCMPNLAALRSSATGGDTVGGLSGGLGSPGGNSLRGLSGGGASGQDLRLPSTELRAGSGGPSNELRAPSAGGSDTASGFHGGYGGGNPLGSGGGHNPLGSGYLNPAYPAGSMRSASGRLLPAADGSGGVHISGGYGGFGTAAAPGADAASQLGGGYPPAGGNGNSYTGGVTASVPAGGGGGQQAWAGGEDVASVRSLSRLSDTRPDAMRRDAGLPSMRSLSSDQQQGLTSPNGTARLNPFQGGRAAFHNLIAQAQSQQQPQQQQLQPKQQQLDQWQHKQPAAGLPQDWQWQQQAQPQQRQPQQQQQQPQQQPQQRAAAQWGPASAELPFSSPAANLPLAAAVTLAAAALPPMQLQQQQGVTGRGGPAAHAPWVKEPGSPVLAGDPRLIDELMQEMAGGGAWPAEQGASVSAALVAPPLQQQDNTR